MNVLRGMDHRYRIGERWFRTNANGHFRTCQGLQLDRKHRNTYVSHTPAEAVNANTFNTVGFECFGKTFQFGRDPRAVCRASKEGLEFRLVLISFWRETSQREWLVRLEEVRHEYFCFQGGG